MTTELERPVMQQDGVTADFLDKSWIKTSEYPANFLPAGSIAIDRASEDGDCTVKGFYDAKTGEIHIQEVVHNRLNSPAAQRSGGMKS